MGQKSIIEKINDLVRSWETYNIEEKDVVYLFVELGKYLEQGIHKDQFPNLRFFRNWTAHNRIDDIRVIKEFVPAIQSSQSESLDGNDGFKQIFKNLFSELSSFLSMNGIDPSSIHKREDEFLGSLIAVISEQPLVLKKATQYLVVEPNSRRFTITDNPAKA